VRAARRFAARVVGLVRPGRHERRLREEFDGHVAMLTEEGVRAGLTEEEARRRALRDVGTYAALRDSHRDESGFPWLDALAADVLFGWRQLRKHPVVSGAAVLSLALTIGATTSAFRLVDALLLRPLPVAEPERLHVLSLRYIDREGRSEVRDDYDYPSFLRYRDAVSDKADVLLAGMIGHPVAVPSGDGEPERVFRQYVSGNLFPVFGLQAAAGRLLLPSDDAKPGGSPVAVISYEYWTRKYGRDLRAVGKTLALGPRQYEIVGVTPEGYTGTSRGDAVDVFVPATMNIEALDKAGWSWFQILLRPHRGVAAEQVRQPLQALLAREHQERLKFFPADAPRATIEAMLREELVLEPAAAGASRLQKEYRRPLLILGVLVVLVLLVACANVANLMTAQAAARAKEMAVRVSIGAGRGRLIQMVLVESAMLAVAASVCGAWFAEWAAPFVTSLLRLPEDPVRLALDAGWRELAFGGLLAGLVTLLFGLGPALRASAASPALAIKGDADPHARQRTMRFLLATQVAFCLVVLFAAGLFGETFRRLVNRPFGFDTERVLTVDVERKKQAVPAEVWSQVEERLRSVPGVESVTLASWPLISRNRWSATVRVPGKEPEARSPYFLQVMPGFLAAMKIRLVSGREFRLGDQPPSMDEGKEPRAGVAIVNEAFARTYFHGANPVGQTVEVQQGNVRPSQVEIVGLMGDTAYSDVRDPIRPVVFIPVLERPYLTAMVRVAAGDPKALTGAIREEVGRIGPGFEARNMQPYENFIRWQTMRERLLSVLSSFFAGVALVLAAIGLYGVLHYSVTCRRREIGIRMALGARAADVVRRLTVSAGLTVGAGVLVGLVCGVAGGRLLERLLFEVKATDGAMMAFPVALLGMAALAAAIPPALRATRIDPARTLRNE